MNKWIACALLSVAPVLSQASVLTGDTITFTVNPGVVAPTPALVGPGVDLTFGDFQFDFDAGPSGNQFVYNATGAGSLAGSTSITLSDLDFTDGSVLTGFSLTSTLFTGLSISETGHSITFSYTNTGLIGPGTVLNGTFLTTAVPTPETLPLLMAGVAGLAIASRRRMSNKKRA